MNKHPLPPDLTPINLKAYFFNALGACGCSELNAMHTTVLALLEWHANREHRQSYDTLYNHVGVFYLLLGLLDGLGLSEHGSSIRSPWLTPDGERLVNALREHNAEAIDSASGEAYDGCSYGDD